MKIPLIINDRLDIALAKDAEGLHIGQYDMPYAIARRLLGSDKIIGLSVENFEQAEQANKINVDYIGLSPVFATGTKPGHPEPHVKEGIWLAKYPGVHAMMDVSDGLSSDLSHILKASGKSAVVNLEKLPVSDTLKRVALEQKWNLDKLVSSGGEDYVLLCTIHAGHYEKINSASRATFGKELFPVGEIIDGKNQILWMKNGKQVTPDKHEWNHFTA